MRLSRKSLAIFRKLGLAATEVRETGPSEHVAPVNRSRHAAKRRRRNSCRLVELAFGQLTIFRGKARTLLPGSETLDCLRVCKLRGRFHCSRQCYSRERIGGRKQTATRSEEHTSELQ